MATKKPKKPTYNDMEWIDDKTLLRAVMFARKMMREGTSPQRANTVAANYYRVSVTDVAKHTGQAAGNIKARRGRRGR